MESITSCVIEGRRLGIETGVGFIGIHFFQMEDAKAFHAVLYKISKENTGICGTSFIGGEKIDLIVRD